MKTNTSKVFDVSKKYNVNARYGAYILGIERIAKTLENIRKNV